MGDMASRHAGLKDALSLLLLAGNDHTFFIENVDQAPQHADQG